ncbi:hypothetical protein D3C85_1090160 [compost metagenome]
MLLLLASVTVLALAMRGSSKTVGLSLSSAVPEISVTLFPAGVLAVSVAVLLTELTFFSAWVMVYTTVATAVSPGAILAGVKVIVEGILASTRLKLPKVTLPVFFAVNV